MKAKRAKKRQIIGPSPPRNPVLFLFLFPYPISTFLLFDSAAALSSKNPHILSPLFLSLTTLSDLEDGLLADFLPHAACTHALTSVHDFVLSLCFRAGVAEAQLFGFFAYA